MAIAIETAETGHLVFGTLHTTTAHGTIDRIIDQFPTDRQEQIRMMLSDGLKGVISQMLCKKIGGGRVPALEIMIASPSISNLIREGKTFQIPSIMQSGKRFGMCMMNDSFVDLVKKQVVKAEDAYAKAVDKAGLLAQFKRNGVDTSWAPKDLARARTCAVGLSGAPARARRAGLLLRADHEGPAVPGGRVVLARQLPAAPW